MGVKQTGRRMFFDKTVGTQCMFAEETRAYVRIVTRFFAFRKSLRFASLENKERPVACYLSRGVVH